MNTGAADEGTLSAKEVIMRVISCAGLLVAGCAWFLMAAYLLPMVLPFPSGSLAGAMNLAFLYGALATFATGGLIGLLVKLSKEKSVGPRLAFYTFCTPAFVMALLLLIFGLAS